MVRQQREQPVTAITTTPAGVHIGMPVFAVVGTDGTDGHTTEHTIPYLNATPRLR
jgi:hypothetical protein